MNKIRSNEEDLRKRVYAFIDLNLDAEKKFIANHFIMEKESKSTIYDIIKRKENGIQAERQVGSGRPAKKMNKKAVKRLIGRINHRDGVSQRRLAKIFDCSQPHICKTIKNKTNIRYRKKKRAPKRTSVQKAAIRPKCRKLSIIFRKKAIIMDDESYFGLSNTELSGNAGFYTSDPNLTSDDVKTKRKSKFEKKLLVWVAFSEKGLSRHYVVPSGQAIDADVYVQKCLPRLVSFIKEHHEKDQVVFWPDLASSHYSNKALEYLSDQKIDVVPKNSNPATHRIENATIYILRLHFQNATKTTFFSHFEIAF